MTGILIVAGPSISKIPGPQGHITRTCIRKSYRQGSSTRSGITRKIRHRRRLPNKTERICYHISFLCAWQYNGIIGPFLKEECSKIFPFFIIVWEVNHNLILFSCVIDNDRSICSPVTGQGAKTVSPPSINSIVSGLWYVWRPWCCWVLVTSIGN